MQNAIINSPVSFIRETKPCTLSDQQFDSIIDAWVLMIEIDLKNLKQQKQGKVA